MADEMLKLGKELFDRIEIRAVGRQEEGIFPRIPDGAARGLSLVAAEIVDDRAEDLDLLSGGGCFPSNSSSLRSASVEVPANRQSLYRGGTNEGERKTAAGMAVNKGAEMRGRQKKRFLRRMRTSTSWRTVGTKIHTTMSEH